LNLLLENAKIIDPSQDLNKKGNVAIEEGKIKGFPKKISESGYKDYKRIDCTGKIVSPGLIDLHVHLREPGYEYKETIKTGTEAAAAGGFTTIVCMPNTNPINDNASVTEFILYKARTEGVVNVLPIGAITIAEEGEALAHIGEMYEAGCVGISDDGMSVMDSGIMRSAMDYVKAFNIPVLIHAEDKGLSCDGVMNEGFTSTVLGLRGIPNSSEEVMIARDINLCELTGTHLHICHVSTRGSVRLIREAKSRGVNVTAEATPHHFHLTDEIVKDYNTFAKVNPPIRTSADVQAIRQGLADGTIDVIATDHAPHSEDEKKVEFDKAPFGISGLETALQLSLQLVEQDVISLEYMISKFTNIPAKVIGLDKGTLKEGADADLVVFNTEDKSVIDRHKFYSKGKNTPFHDWKVKGKVNYTIVNGRIVYKNL